MCGFVAVLSPGDNLPEPVIAQMRDSLAHRGPDGAGLWQKKIPFEGAVDLGFRRLAIVDLDPRASQPMVSQDNRCVIVFNGEIYNYAQMRLELEQLGRVFVTDGDTEVLLQGYQQWGKDVITRLNGMFSFLIWDDERREALVARDRFGEKPLYFYELPNGGIVIASEIKALFCHPDLSANPNTEVMSSIVNGVVYFGREETAFLGVEQFKASHFMILRANGERCSYQRYWEPDYTPYLNDCPPNEIETQFEQLLRESVVTRAKSDVAMTACLSGGLDSTSLVGLLTEMDSQKAGAPRLNRTISARFPDDATIDEGVYIDAALNHFGIEGESVTPTADQFISDLRQLHWHHETVIPGASMYLEWSIMKKASALGYKVIIDGQGADELLAGYATYFRSYQQDLLHAGDVLRAIRIGEWRDRRLKAEASKYKDPQRRFATSEGLTKRQLLNGFGFAQARAKENIYGSDGLPDVQEVGCLRHDLAVNLLYTSLPSNLFSGDRNSMAHGIECRYPFLDYRFVDFCLALPNREFLDDLWQKSVLRNVMAPRLPSSVVWRVDKVGFAAPEDRWLSSPMAKKWMLERLSDPSASTLLDSSSSGIASLVADFRSGADLPTSHLWQLSSALELSEMIKLGYWDGAQIGDQNCYITTGENPSREDSDVSYQKTPDYNSTSDENPFSFELIENREASLSVPRGERIKADYPRFFYVLHLIKMSLVWLSNLAFLGVYLIKNKPTWRCAFSEWVRYAGHLMKYRQKTDLSSVYCQKAPESLGKKNIWIISFTEVASEPRVLRQAEALFFEGHRIVVAGFRSPAAVKSYWNFVQLPKDSNYTFLYRKFLGLRRRIFLALCMTALSRRIRKYTALKAHRSIPLWEHIRLEVLEFAERHPELSPDLVLAHDYYTCDLAISLAEKYSAAFSVDCHEYARGQYAHDKVWLLRTLPYVKGMHDNVLPRADVVTTVSRGIADLLDIEEDLNKPVEVIKSVPFYSKQPFRKVGDRIKVLYHGDISYIRGLHKAIKSMPLWREEFDLLIRGNGDQEYIRSLNNISDELGLSDRVLIEDAVPFDQIIPRANEADIGYFVHKNVSPQKAFVLPNKFFEYIMAGLALCVSDLPEMARVTQEFDLGLLVSEYNEEQIARTINQFDKDIIEYHKYKSLDAAKRLNWEEEKKKLVDLYNCSIGL